MHNFLISSALIENILRYEALDKIALIGFNLEKNTVSLLAPKGEKICEETFPIKTLPTLHPEFPTLIKPT